MSSPPVWSMSRPWYRKTGYVWLLAFSTVLCLVFSVLVYLQPATSSGADLGWQHSALQDTAEIDIAKDVDNLRILLPATDPNVNLCKTLLTGGVLGYPVPTLIGFNQTHQKGWLLGGGSHVTKITGVLKHLESLDPSADNDLVLMMDAYDIWFQLRPEVIVERYHAINAEANKRLEKRLGKAVEIEGLKQTLIFGSGKRCTNEEHTVACYPLPASPLPDDVYGENTDTVIGRSRYTSIKQRYLNSGFVIGPVADMRRLFQRAQEKVKKQKSHPDFDNGSHGADYLYHGSDQSVFNTILGEQEFQREVMRRRHRTFFDRITGRAGWPAPTRIDGTIIRDPLNPHFVHQAMAHKEGHPDEFGVGLDYFSELGHQTVNSEHDGKYITYNKDIDKQVGNRSRFDCPNHVTNGLPFDIQHSNPPYDPNGSWNSTSLYTNVCLNTIPVMIHHNGDKHARESQWTRLWIQPNARQLMKQVLESKEYGAASAKGFHAWKDLCPRSMDIELYRSFKPSRLGSHP